ncbi:erg24, C-14 sterol reductase [Entomophthora muscae]|uniref:Erg24, C-14 sterol reductase n=1 Tax=Entomophthora muscae TaxID=34485 RepID=A0ACC2UHA9_9FUNG|nr:erg24, C-14 sterol reductase [Entomophthora muscae]
MKKQKLNPKSTEFEFFGPIGCTVVMVISPLFLLMQYLICNEEGGCLASPGYVLGKLVDFKSFYSFKAAGMYFGWLIYHVIMWAVVPGPWVAGTRLRNGNYVQYKMNAFRIFLITAGLTLATFLTYGTSPFLAVTQAFPQLVVISITYSAFQSVVLYMHSFTYENNKLLALNGNTGVFVHDFWMGRELNPSVFGLDLKEFFELRPGLMGWAFLNVCFVVKQYALLGYSRVTFSILFVAFCQIGYVADSLYNQAAVLTTMDITTDGFGFMLSFGDISFVPFLYPIQTRYLSMYPQELTGLATVFLLASASLGYYIFRSANCQKNDFRRDPNDPKLAHLKYIKTDTGRNLLISGWWGYASHINYLGDWLLSLSQCLACGFGSPVPYLFAAYFAVLLVHRDSRDDHECSKKYGESWKKYRATVPYRILPYVY